jgi:transcriptional regulator with XRE-family HTH domain
MSQWESELHARIAEAIKTHRSGRSAQELADRTAELGYPISRAQIANYESGRKKNLDVAELLIIAAALDVSPVVLLYPELPDGDVEVIPGRPTNSWAAYLWAAGMAPSFMDPSTSSRGDQLIDAVSRRWQMILRLGSLTVQISGAANNAPLQESLKQEESRVRGEIGWLNALIRELGGVLKDAQTEDEARGTRPDQ